MNKINTILNKLMLCIVMIVMIGMIPHVFGLEADDIMGDPATSLQDITPQIQWITGTFEGTFLVVAVLAVFAAGILFFAGAFSGSGEGKGKGIGIIIGIVFVVILVTIAIRIIFTLYNGF